MKQNNLADLENIIEKNRRKFNEIGKALRRIRDGRLYRELLFDSFESYVMERWDMARSQAYRLMEASKIIDNLSPIGDGVLPQNESQTRPLSRLKTIDQRKIWREFIESGTALNASNIRKFVNMRVKKPAPESKPESRVDIIASDFKEAVLAMLEQIRLAQNDHWQKTSRQAALFWLRVMKEKIKSNA